MPTHGPNRMPPDIIAMVRTLISEPSTLIPESVPKMANREKIVVTAASSSGVWLWLSFCSSLRNRRVRVRKNRQINIRAARSKTASNISNTCGTAGSWFAATAYYHRECQTRKPQSVEKHKCDENLKIHLYALISSALR